SEAMRLVGGEPAIDGAATDPPGAPVRPDVEALRGVSDGGRAHLSPGDAYPNFGHDAEAEQGHRRRGPWRPWKRHPGSPGGRARLARRSPRVGGPKSRRPARERQLNELIALRDPEVRAAPAARQRPEGEEIVEAEAAAQAPERDAARTAPSRGGGRLE